MSRVQLLILLLAGCGDHAATQNEAAAAGRAFLVDRHMAPATVTMLQAIDMGDRWRLSFQIQPVGAGGGFLVVVNKRSGEVVHAEASQ